MTRFPKRYDYSNRACSVGKFFKGWRRKVGLVTLAMTAYLVAYFAIVEAEPSGIYQIGAGPFPKVVIYPIGGRADMLGKVRRYNLDSFTHPFFAPINQIDRRLRPSVWHE